MSPLEAALEALVRRIVDERLRVVNLAPPTDYSLDHLPPDVKSKERFYHLARRCPGARKVGRTWMVPIEAWHAFRTAPAPDLTADVAATVAKMLGH